MGFFNRKGPESSSSPRGEKERIPFTVETLQHAIAIHSKAGEPQLVLRAVLNALELDGISFDEPVGIHIENMGKTLMFDAQEKLDNTSTLEGQRGYGDSAVVMYRLGKAMYSLKDHVRTNKDVIREFNALLRKYNRAQMKELKDL